MTTTREILAQSVEMMGRVPHVDSGSVCRACLGPVSNYEFCYACHDLFRRQGAPGALIGKVVPMTSALSPSRWYTWLRTYKGYHPERGSVLASLAYEYIQTNRDSIRGLLGGEPSHTSIVPSKRGHTFETQPFRRSLARVQLFADTLVEVIQFRQGESIAHREYNPDAFATALEIQQARVVLLEDTWATGATALSAGGAMLAAGARSVVVIPLARMIEDSYWPPDHPYRAEMRKPFDPFDPDLWPR